MEHTELILKKLPWDHDSTPNATPPSKFNEEFQKYVHSIALFKGYKSH
jgi:hypothetical protein